MPANPCFNWQKISQGREKDFGLTSDQIRPLWEWIKREYLDTGMGFEKTIQNLVMDTGAPPRFWYEVMSGPKATRYRTWELLVKEYNRQNAVDRARKILEWGDKTIAGKMISSAVNMPRASLTLFHGGVFPVTHGGGLLLTPSRWNSFAKGWWVSWKLAPRGFTKGARDSVKAAYVDARLKLVADDIHEFAKNSGLKVNPNEGPQGILSGFLAARPNWSRRAWLGLQVMRQELFKGYMARFPAEHMDEATYRAIGKQMADIANKATGVTNRNIGELGNFAFAPQLTASKWDRAVTDPYQTLKTIGLNPAKFLDTFGKMVTGKGAEVTSAERAAAYIRLRYATEFVAVTYAGLLLNDALLQAFDPNGQRINFRDPLKADWMRFKAAGLVMSSRGPEEIVRLFGRLVAIGHASTSPQRLQQQFRTTNPMAAMVAAGAQFAQYKLNPNIQAPGELLAGTDLFGRPLPPALQKIREAAGLRVPKATEHKQQFTNTEYALERGPIFIGGGARDIYESLRERGLSSPDALALMRGAAIMSGEFAGFGAYRERHIEAKPEGTIIDQMKKARAAEKKQMFGGKSFKQQIKESLANP